MIETGDYVEVHAYAGLWEVVGFHRNYVWLAAWDPNDGYRHITVDESRIKTAAGEG